MTEEQHKKQISRREFLTETLKKTGYVLPAIAVIKLSTVDSWASNYGLEQTTANKGDSCNGFFEKIFNTKCWR